MLLKGFVLSQTVGLLCCVPITFAGNGTNFVPKRDWKNTKSLCFLCPILGPRLWLNILIFS